MSMSPTGPPAGMGNPFLKIGAVTLKARPHGL